MKSSILLLFLLPLAGLAQESVFLGVYIERISEEKAEALGFPNPYGSYISGIIPGTAAARAGLQPLDYIVGVDQHMAREGRSLGSILRQHTPGERVTLHIYRAGRKQTLWATLGRKSDSRKVERGHCEEPFLGIRPESGIDGSRRGVGVRIVDNSTAEAMDVKDGDLILSINGAPMVDWTDIKIAIDNMEVGDPIRIELQRQGRRLVKTAPIRSQCDTKPEVPAVAEPDPGAWFDRYFKEEDRERVGPSSIAVSDLGSSGISAANQSYGLSLPVSNNLQVRNLKTVMRAGEKDQLELAFDLPASGDTQVRIYKSSGRLVYSYELGAFSGSFEDETNLLQNGTGDYFLEIRQGSRSQVKQIKLR